jgi:hypothetical protein
MKREQIIEILISNEEPLAMDLFGISEEQYPTIADAIMALPIEIPSDEEAEDMATLYASEEGGEDFEQMLQQPDFIAFYDGAIKMRDDIIRRNK